MQTLTAQPFAASKELDSLRTQLNINVPQPERVGSMIAGAGLAAWGLSRRSLGGLLIAAVGGALIRRGVTGHCELYQNLGINSRKLQRESGVPGNKGIKVVKSVVVSRPREEVYRYWRNLENLPRFMEHVESVRELDNLRSSWVVRGPMGHDVEWNAEILTDRPNELISWQSLPGAEVQNAGSVWFEPAQGGSATEVKVALQYQPPAGVIGATVAKFFGEAPEQQLETDLAKFKTLIEQGAPAPASGAS